ncbi:hypothetical protein FE90_0379 [Streptococcus pyogenes]|nr:hypothetical protein FE90_0379 [Streptococcus pyogenes]
METIYCLIFIKKHDNLTDTGLTTMFFSMTIEKEINQRLLLREGIR